MDALDSTHPLLTVVGVATAAVLLLIARIISRAEQMLVSSAGLLLAGVFFLTRTVGEPATTVVGVTFWAIGLALFVRTARAWSGPPASRASAVLGLVLLPPVFAGAVVLGGALMSLAVAPARLLLRLLE
jgi:hypothetical protein